MTDAYDFTATALDGSPQPLAAYRGKVMLIVNTASKCGFTPQYAGLEKLHEDFPDLAVLGFPCNQFGKQEPGDATEISNFCSLTYDVAFPLFAKIEVNGAGAHPLFKWLKTQVRGIFGTTAIKWNFTKFLVDRNGRVVGRFAPSVKPDALREKIKRLVAKPA